MVTIFSEREAKYQLPKGYQSQPKGTQDWGEYFSYLGTLAKGKPFIWVARTVDPLLITDEPFTAFAKGKKEIGLVSLSEGKQTEPALFDAPYMSVVYFSSELIATLDQIRGKDVKHFWGIDAVFALLAKQNGLQIWRLPIKPEENVSFRETDKRPISQQNKEGKAQTERVLQAMNPDWQNVVKGIPFFALYIPQPVDPKKSPAVPANHPLSHLQLRRQYKDTEPFELSALDPKKDLDSRTRKIAFCFLTVNGLPNESVWKAFFERADALCLPYSIHNHCKSEPCEFLKPYKTPTVHTTWRNTVPALVELIRAAKGANAHKAVFVSESCLPLKSPERFWQKLQHDYTVVTRFKVWNEVRNHAPQYWQKNVFHEQWTVADGRHFDVLLSDSRIIQDCKKMHADNEFWLFAMIREAKRTHEVRASDFLFVDWGQRIYEHPATFLDREALRRGDFQKDPNRKHFKGMDRRELLALIDDPGYLMGRKFHPSLITPEVIQELSS